MASSKFVIRDGAPVELDECAKEHAPTCYMVRPGEWTCTPDCPCLVRIYQSSPVDGIAMSEKPDQLS